MPLASGVPKISLVGALNLRPVAVPDRNLVETWRQVLQRDVVCYGGTASALLRLPDGSVVRIRAWEGVVITEFNMEGLALAMDYIERATDEF